MRAMRVLRHIKLIRLMRAQRVISRVSSRISISHTSQTLISCLVAILLASHWYACIMALQASFHPSLSDTFLGTFGYCDDSFATSTEATTESGGGVLARKLARECPGLDLAQWYIAAFSWSSMVITGTGGTDAYPSKNSVAETILVVFLVIFGALLWTQVLAAFCDMATNADPGAIEYRQLVDEVNRFCHQEKLPQEPTEIRTQTWKNDWRIPFQLGYVHLLELNDLPSSETYFSEAREHPEAPLYVRKIGERLGSPEGRFAVARNVLNALLEQAKNQNATNSLSQELELKIQDLALAEFFFFANRTLEQRAAESGSPAESGSLSPKSNASSIAKLTLESREQLFNRLVQSGLIPALDPLGARVEFRSTEDAPNGKVTSSTPRRPVMGIQP
jgi:hypothetical protein